MILLATLRLGEEAYGVSILREIEAQTQRDVSQAAAYLTLKRLEGKGWIRREECSNDRRAKRVFLTEAADTPMQVMREIASGVREDALSGLSSDDRDHFVDTLLTIKSNLMGQGNGTSRGNGRGGR